MLREYLEYAEEAYRRECQELDDIVRRADYRQQDCMCVTWQSRVMSFEVSFRRAGES